MGNSTFLNRKSDPVSFTHKQSSYSMTYDIENKVFINEVIPRNLVGNALQDDGDIKFAGLSPYATWIIEIDENNVSNKGLDMSNLSKIIFSFSFQYIIPS